MSEQINIGQQYAALFRQFVALWTQYRDDFDALCAREQAFLPPCKDPFPPSPAFPSLGQRFEAIIEDRLRPSLATEVPVRASKLRNKTSWG